MDKKTLLSALMLESSAPSPTLQAKTNIAPTTSSQTISPDDGYDGLSSVQINAMPNGSVTAPASISDTGATVSTGTNTLTLTKSVSVTPSVTTPGYVSGGTAGTSSVSLTASVNTRSSSDLTASGATVTAPAGYYAAAASKSVSSMTLPSSASSSSSGSSKATIAAATSTRYLNIPAGYNSTAQYYKLSAISPTKSAETYTPTTSDQTISSGRWLSGNQTIKGDANLVAENIKKGVSIFGVVGEHEGGGAATPTLSPRSDMPQLIANVSAVRSGQSYTNVPGYFVPTVGETTYFYTENRWELSSLYEEATGTPVPFTTISTSSYGSQYSFVMPNASVAFDLYYND